MDPEHDEHEHDDLSVAEIDQLDAELCDALTFLGLEEAPHDLLGDEVVSADHEPGCFEDRSFEAQRAGAFCVLWHSEVRGMLFARQVWVRVKAAA